ncbi:MAG: DUF3570 domain-containing protein, partial [Pontibacter sp.]|nr:DUF3570 domain-containing protein [Pontibacter sp.]
MRMQLKYILMLAACTLTTASIAQTTNRNSGRRARELTPAEVNILGSYYSQDGKHSPVTGGVGTEQLTDVTPTIIVNVPLDTATNLNVNFGMDFYSSASTDKIDFNVSSASKSDVRTHLNVGISRRNASRRIIKSITIGGSTEYDYQSVSLGVNWSQESADGNRELSLGALAYYDVWSLIYPVELRGNGPLLSTDKRQSYSISATLSQVINRRMQAAISSDVVYQTGLLSTPFHRVYFKDQEMPDIERLPDTRLKYPLGLRLNYYTSDYLTMRFFYRFYSDSWGMTANTFEVETPVKVGPFFSFYPYYRYHTQTAIDYFAPFREHLSTETYYTSDFDLSGINSHKVGLGVRYSPLQGITKFGLPFSKNST